MARTPVRVKPAGQDRAEPGVAVQQRRWWWDLPLLVLFACLLRWPYLDVPISADEGGYATAAYWWARGDTLYREITITRPQGIFVVFRLIEALGLGSVRGIHLFAAGYTALSTLVLYALGRRIWGRAIGLGAAALFALVLATPYVEGYSANAELFMALPLLLSAALLLAADQRWRAWRLAAAGGCSAVALLIKPAGVAVLVLGALWLCWTRDGDAARRAWLRAEVAFAGGALAVLALAVAHGLLTAPDDYFNAVLLYRLRADSVIAGAASYQLAYFTLNTLYVAGHLAPIVLLAVVGLATMPAGTPRLPRARRFLILWLVTALGGMALGGDWFIHYYQQLVPPLALAAALGARTLLRRQRAPALIAAQGLAAGGSLMLVLVLLPTFTRPADPTTLPEYEPGVRAAGPVAAYLRAHTTPGETIYVAYDHADIYYLAQRRPAARWLHFRELTRTPGAFAEQVARIANPATAPRYIVGAQSFDRWGLDADGALRALVARDYTLETTIESIPLYRRRE